MGDESSQRLGRLLGAAEPSDLDSLYKRHGVDPHQEVDVLLNRILLDGSNTIASMFRGFRGVPYLEVVRDVAKKLAVADEILALDDEVRIERAILGKVIEEHLTQSGETSQEEIREILLSAGVESREYKRALATGTLAMVIAVLSREAIEQVVRTLVIKAGARAAAAAGAARLVAFAVPLLNLVLAAWTVFDIAGPAFRKTVPSIIEVALIRLQEDR